MSALRIACGACWRRVAWLRTGLEVAIAESALVRYLDDALVTLGRLREGGVRVALEGFGTGNSSLYYLRNFKLDKIKIDRSFIKSMGSERQSDEIISALIGLGRGLGPLLRLRVSKELLKPRLC